MIPRAARAELPPRRIFLLARDARDAPIAIHHRMRLRRPMLDADAKLRPAVERFLVAIEVLRNGFNRLIQHRKLHPAGDIDANRVRNHRVFASQHTADRQPIANVRIRHQRSADRIRNLARNPHLLVRTGVDIRAPSLVTDRLVANRHRLGHQFASKLAPNRVCFITPADRQQPPPPAAAPAAPSSPSRSPAPPRATGPELLPSRNPAAHQVFASCLRFMATHPDRSERD